MPVTPAANDAAATSPQALERLGRYALIAPLGQGGMGTLHLAVAGGLGEFRKLLVLKELRRDLATNSGFLEMFMAEAKVAARMNHPNIVQTLEAGQDGDRFFLAMEFLDGQPLNEVIKHANSEPRISLQLRLQILCEVLSGLHYAHELCDFDDMPLQIVHRDISPHNVFVTYHGQIKLLDFGIAKANDIEHSTNAGVFKGRFSYAAPEQVMCRVVDRRADVFAVGVMLWEAVAGRRFAPGSVTETAVDARIAGTEPRIAQVAPDMSPELARICDRAIHVDPGQRYPSAEAFRVELLDYLLASSELVQPAQIGELLRNKFAARRTAMHRAIYAQGKHLLGLEDFGGSIVRSLTTTTTTPTPAPVSFEGDGDFAALNERSRSDIPTVRPGARNAKTKSQVRTRRMAWLLLPAAASFIGTYLWVRAELAEPARSAPPPVAATPPAPAPAAPTPAPNIPPPPSAAASNLFSDPPQPAPERNAAQKPRGRSSRRSSAAPLPTSSALPPAEQDAAPALVIKRSPSPVREPAGEGSPETGPVAPPTLELGADLRTRRKSSAPRRIDVENPFR